MGEAWRVLVTPFCDIPALRPLLLYTTYAICTVYFPGYGEIILFRGTSQIARSRKLESADRGPDGTRLMAGCASGNLSADSKER